MAGQFDKFVKILGNSSRPARYKGAPGNPDIAASVETNAPASTADNTNRSLPANAPKQVAADKAGKQASDVAFNQKFYSKGSRKRQIDDLKTTTMRLDSKTGEAYDAEEVKPPASGRVMPARKANPKYLAADVQRQNEDTQSFIAADSKRTVGDQDSTGEAAFSKSEAAKGSSIRSLNGVTYDTKDYDNYLGTLPANQISKAIKPYDISEFEPKATAGTSKSAGETISTSALKEGPNKSENPMDYDQDPKFTKVDKIKARKGGTVYGSKVIDDYQKEHPDSSASSAATGKTLSQANMAGTTPYDKEGNVKPEYNDPSTIYSTTMSERNGEVVEGGVQKAPYQKPPVAKKGNVIPPIALDTFGSQSTDRKQAEAENKRLREGRGTPTSTSVFDPNVRSARRSRGQTPERQAVLGGIREERAASLASEGKEMTTVRPDVMATAKGLGATSMYNLDDNYMSSPGFLAHEAVQKATVAHALGVHHTLGTDDDHLHKYLGGKPLEAKSRLAAAYKVVDRNLRGNPEKVAGEFALLRGMVHAGSSPQQTLRAARGGSSSNVVVNGQNVTLAEGSSENRQRIADNTTNITAQAESAPKAARLGSIAGTPTAPLAGTGRVAVRRIGQDPQEAQVREFSPQERRNVKTNVPSSDDSKRKLGPVEKEVESDSTSIVERLKKGPKLDESEK